MRTVLGALVGLLVGATLVAALCGMAGVKGYWPIIPVGLIAGLAMRQLANSINPSYLKGALAALATVLALIGGQLGAANLINNQSSAATDGAAAAVVKAATGEAAADGDGAPPPPTPETRGDATGAPRGTIGLRNMNNDFPMTDAIWLAAGCLIAYQLGKGGVGQLVVDDQDRTPEELSGTVAEGEAAGGDDA